MILPRLSPRFAPGVRPPVRPSRMAPDGPVSGRSGCFRSASILVISIRISSIGESCPVAADPAINRTAAGPGAVWARPLPQRDRR